MSSINSNKVYCYYDTVDGLVNPQRLIAQWAMSWRNHDWDPRVLSRNDAWQHPKFKHYLMKIAVYPSINPKGYDETCWLRWLAFDVVGGGVMSDYDVINVGFKAPDEMMRGPIILEKARVPCVVAADARGASDIVARLHEPSKKPLHHHYSDMIFFQESDYPAIDVCREIMHPGWEIAQLIHFSRHGCRQHSPQTNKHDVVTKVTGIP